MLWALGQTVPSVFSSPRAASLRLLPPPDLPGARSSCESLERARPRWIRSHALGSRIGRRSCRFHTNQRFRAQASDDCQDIQMMHLGELSWPEFVYQSSPTRWCLAHRRTVWDRGRCGWPVLTSLITRCLRPKGNETRLADFDVALQHFGQKL